MIVQTEIPQQIALWWMQDKYQMRLTDPFEYPNL